MNRSHKRINRDKKVESSRGQGKDRSLTASRKVRESLRCVKTYIGENMTSEPGLIKRNKICGMS